MSKNELNKSFSLRISLIAWAVRLAAVTALLDDLAPNIPNRLPDRIADTLLFPSIPFQLSHIITIIVSLALLYLAQQLGRRKRSAFLFTSALMGLMILVELLRFHDHLHPHPQVFLYIVILVVLFLTRSLYTVRSDTVSLSRAVRISTLVISTTFVYGVVGFMLLRERDFHVLFSSRQAMVYTLRQMVNLGNTTLIPHSAYAKRFLESLNLATDTSIVLIFIALFRPVRFRFGALPYERHLAEDILSRWSDSTEDFFKLWPHDKHYFFEDTREAFVAFKVIGSTALVLDGPSGNPKYIPDLLKGFDEYCSLNGWRLAIVHGDKKWKKLYDGLGLKQLTIGQEAIVNVAQFVETTQNNKHFRYIRNRAQRENLSFQLWTPPLSDQQVASLRHISDAWLAHGNRHEYTFAMGYFDDEYIRLSTVAVIENEQSEAIAYANVIPSFVKKARTIDHMRSVPDASQVTMHYLFMQLLSHMHEHGITTFNLGLVPLAESNEQQSTTEKALSVVKRLGGSFYSFGGLEQFKNKFDPTWQPRYLYHPQQALVPVASALNTAMSVQTVGATIRRELNSKKVLLVLAVIAAIANGSFPFAVFLNRAKLYSGLVSDLGEQGQPYAHFFNSLDVVGGICIMILCTWLYIRDRHTLPKMAKATLVLLGLSGLGGLIAAVVALGPQYADMTEVQILHHLDFAIIIHGVASTLNSGGIIAGMVTWIFWKKFEVEHKPIYTIFVVATLVISVVGFFGGLSAPIIGYAAQRLFILMLSWWIVWVSLMLYAQADKHVSP